MTPTEIIAEEGARRITNMLDDQRVTPLEKRLYVTGVSDMMHDAIGAVEESARETREYEAHLDEDELEGLEEEFEDELEDDERITENDFWHNDYMPDTPHRERHEDEDGRGFREKVSDRILIKFCDGNYGTGVYVSSPKEDRGFWVNEIHDGFDMGSRTLIKDEDVVAWAEIPRI